MSALLGVLLALGGLLTAIVGGTTLSLRSSDAAGNGLAEVFLAVSVIALWLLIGATLIVAATRPPRLPLHWPLINASTILLFLIAAGGQFAALQLLSGPRIEGGYRLVVQAAVILTPVVALIHGAWRGMGTPVPVALELAALAVLLGSAIPLWGLRATPRPVARAPADPIEAVAYPALLLPGLTRVVEIASAEALRAGGRREMLAAPGDTYLIDARFEIFVLREHHHPAGRAGATPGFRLVEWEPDGTAAAALTLLLRVPAWRADPGQDAAIRQRLAGQTTLEGMARVIRGE